MPLYRADSTPFPLFNSSIIFFSVNKLTILPGSIKEPGALALWHETLRELGVESKEPQELFLPNFGSIKLQKKLEA